MVFVIGNGTLKWIEIDVKRVFQKNILEASLEESRRNFDFDKL